MAAYEDFVVDIFNPLQHAVYLVLVDHEGV